MTKNPITGSVPGSRQDILRLMVKHNKTGLPIVKGKEKTLVGFISRQDIFAHPEEEQLALLMNKEYATIKQTDTVRKAAKILVENNIHHLPIVEKKKVVGIVTPADVLLVVEKKNIKRPIEDHIRTHCVPISEHTPLNVASEIIRISEVYALPVLNDKGLLSGIVTDRDLFNVSVVRNRIETSDLGLGEDEDSWTWDGFRNIMILYYEINKIDLPKIPVKEIMIKDPLTAFRKTPVSDVARMMRKNDYGQIPIRDSKDHLIGMVYELDVIAALID